MSENNVNTQNYSNEAIALANTISKARASRHYGNTPTGEVNQIPAKTYKEIIVELLNTETIITEKNIDCCIRSMINTIIMNQNFREYFKQGSIWVITIVPTKNSGFVYGHDEIDRGYHVRTFLTNGGDTALREITTGRSLDQDVFPGSLLRMIPAELKQITFTIPEWQTTSGRATPSEVMVLKDVYDKALRKLAQTLNKAK